MKTIKTRKELKQLLIENSKMIKEISLNIQKEFYITTQSAFYITLWFKLEQNLNIELLESYDVFHSTITTEFKKNNLLSEEIIEEGKEFKRNTTKYFENQLIKRHA